MEYNVLVYEVRKAVYEMIRVLNKKMMQPKFLDFYEPNCIATMIFVASLPIAIGTCTPFSLLDICGQAAEKDAEALK